MPDMVQEETPTPDRAPDKTARGTASDTGVWVALWFAALLVLTVGVRIADPTGWLGSDDASYYSAAEHILAGEPIQRVHHHYARMAVILPVAASMWLFGQSPATVALPMVIASGLCSVLVVVLGRLVWSWWVGLCAATVFTLLPYVHLLSTTAFPDVHACFWSTLSVVLAVLGARMGNRSAWVAMAVAVGLATGLAMSAKVFAITTLIPVVLVYRLYGRQDYVATIKSACAVALGVGAILLLEGMFYQRMTGDFWFRLHALRNVSTGPGYFPEEGFYEATRLTTLIWNRLTMPLHPHLSGWTMLGVLFLPSAVAVLLLHAKGRPMAMWALGTYCLIAFFPVSTSNGFQPFPKFYGRHILTASVPFSLCLSVMTYHCLRSLLGRRWLHRSWPVVLAVMFALFRSADGDLRGFRDRPTMRVGRAIQAAVAHTRLDENREIFLTPSMYWRYRILFPEALRRNLRVSTDADAPGWWRHVSPDITDRYAPLPPPGRAYLMATPGQLAGTPEYWDYRVGFPTEPLAAWQASVPIVTVARLPNGSIEPIEKDTDGTKPLIVLLARDDVVTEADTSGGSRSYP